MVRRKKRKGRRRRPWVDVSRVAARHEASAGTEAGCHSLRRGGGCLLVEAALRMSGRRVAGKRAGGARGMFQGSRIAAGHAATAGTEAGQGAVAAAAAAVAAAATATAGAWAGKGATTTGSGVEAAQLFGPSLPQLCCKACCRLLVGAPVGSTFKCECVKKRATA